MRNGENEMKLILSLAFTGLVLYFVPVSPPIGIGIGIISLIILLIPSNSEGNK